MQSQYATESKGAVKETMRAYLPEKGTELGDNIAVANSLLERMKGLLGERKLETGKGLLIRPCKSIHTFFMRFSIDAVFLDDENRIVALVRDLCPYRLTPFYLKASAVLELPAGTINKDVSIGDKVNFS